MKQKIVKLLKTKQNLLGHQLKQINYNLIISSFVEPLFIIFLIISFI